MTKKETALLEKLFEAEVTAALSKGIHLVQTKSSTARKLEDDGFIQKRTVTLGGRFPVDVTGYELTKAGRMAYCLTC